MKSFAIIIPTMWCSPLLNQMLPVYCASQLVKEVIIIDNNPRMKPKDLFSHPKIICLPQPHNIFVNPAWNLGVSYTDQYPILANDDIQVSGLRILLEEIQKLFENKAFDLIGASVNNLGKWNGMVMPYNKSNGFPRRSFGCFMACRKYHYIPEQLKVYSGDVFLFDNAQKVGIIGSGFIHSPVSTTIRQYPEIKQIAFDDVATYRRLRNTEPAINIVVRTSNRPNYFAACMESIRKHAPMAGVHITIDSAGDLPYVVRLADGLDYRYYFINRSVIERMVSRFKLTRKPFIYNHYFNVVQPFLHGLVMFLDDDDMLMDAPPLPETLPPDSFFLHKVLIGGRVVPEDKYWNTVTLNHISGLSVVAWAHHLPEWNPQRGGDYDLISYLFLNHHAIWVNKIIAATQTTGNNGKRNDL